MKKTSFLLIIIVCACMNQDYPPEEDYGSLNTLKTIELLDTFTNDLKFDFEDKISKASYHPIYIGPKKDSIELTYSSRKINNRVSQGSYRMPKQEDIELEPPIHLRQKQIVNILLYDR